MEIKDRLKAIGLNTSESEVYLCLLKSGPAKPADVARETLLSRTNCYNVLEKLLGLGLVEEERYGEVKSFRANAPEKLFNIPERQKTIIEGLLPDLRLLTGSLPVSFAKGISEVNGLLEQILTAGDVELFGPADIQTNIPELGILSELLSRSTKRNFLLDAGGCIYVKWLNRLSIIKANKEINAITLADEMIANSLYLLLKSVSRETTG